MEHSKKQILLPIIVWLIFVIGWGWSISYVKNGFGDDAAISFTFKSLLILFCIFLFFILFVLFVALVEISAHKRKYFSFVENYKDFMKKYFPDISFNEFYKLGAVREELHFRKEHLQSAVLMNRLNEIANDINFSANLDERKKAEDLLHFFTFTKAITPYGKILEKGKSVFDFLLFKY